MKKTLLSIVIATSVASCAIAPSQSGFSLISDTKEPVLLNPTVASTKEGKACGRNILGIYSSGDMSIEAAAKNGGIKSISSVEKTVENTIVTNKVCTIVKGN